MNAESRQFTVHPHILYSIIQSQAGTLAKALLEGVMNSIDAGATRVSVQLETDRFTLSDDGRGFQSRQEILDWFEQFGTPHEEGDAVYGKFRMGRGQLMSFGLNIWRTGTFRMEVDIRNNGLDYQLVENLRPVKGCRVEGCLYSKLSKGDLDVVVSEFTELVRFAQIPVSLNGRIISKRPEECKWDMETDEAYIKLKRTGDLAVYNLGVLVREYPSYHYGCGGIVVTKRPVEVNFARNDILTHKCDVWRRINRYLKMLNLKQVATKRSLSDDERDFLAREFTYGNMPMSQVDFESVKLLTDATGRFLSLSDLREFDSVCVVPDNKKQVGALVHRQGRACVLSEATLSRFRVSDLADFLELVERHTGRTLSVSQPDFDEISADLQDQFNEVPLDELPADELAAYQALAHLHEAFFKWFSVTEKSSGQRELRVGESDTRMAWTDGASYIVLERAVLQKAAKLGAPGFYEALVTLVHEYCHDSQDTESHDHDLVFYRKHHDVMQYRSGKLAVLTAEAAKRYVREAKKLGVELRAPTSMAANKAKATVRKMTKAELHRAEFERQQMPLF